jgi:hypothetical protein
MIIQVYQYCGQVSASVATARCVAEFEADELPEDETEFANQYDGDFIEVLEAAR